MRPTSTWTCFATRTPPKHTREHLLSVNHMQPILNHRYIQYILCAFQACSQRSVCQDLHHLREARHYYSRPLVVPRTEQGVVPGQTFAASHEDAKDKQKPAELLRVSAALIWYSPSDLSGTVALRRVRRTSCRPTCCNHGWVDPLQQMWRFEKLIGLLEHRHRPACR